MEPTAIEIRPRVGRLAPLCLAVLAGCGGSDSPDASAGDQRALAQATTTKSIYRGELAYATYFELRNSCDRRTIEVFANTERNKNDGLVSKTASIRAQVTTETCAGDYAFVSGTATAPVVRIPNDLFSAIAKATVPLESFDGLRQTLELNLRWGGGTLFEYPSTRTVTTDPYSRTVITSYGKLRQGMEVIGSMKLDGVEYLPPAPPASEFDTAFVIGRVSDGGGSTKSTSFTP